MLQWTKANAGASLGMIVHCTDGEREFAYGKAAMSTLNQALIDAEQEGWVVVDMKQNWNRIFT